MSGSPVLNFVKQYYSQYTTMAKEPHKKARKRSLQTFMNQLLRAFRIIMWMMSTNHQV